MRAGILPIDGGITDWHRTQWQGLNPFRYQCDMLLLRLVIQAHSQMR
jgi:hypothetical protein